MKEDHVKRHHQCGFTSTASISSKIFLLAAQGKRYIKALVSLFDPMLVVANQGDQTATAGVLVGVKQVRGTCYFIALEDRPQ